MDKVWVFVDQEFGGETEFAIFRTLEGAKAAAAVSMQQWYGDSDETEELTVAIDTIESWQGEGPSFTFSYDDGELELTRLEVQD